MGRGVGEAGGWGGWGGGEACRSSLEGDWGPMVEEGSRGSTGAAVCRQEPALHASHSAQGLSRGSRTRWTWGLGAAPLAPKAHPLSCKWGLSWFRGTHPTRSSDCVSLLSARGLWGTLGTPDPQPWGSVDRIRGLGDLEGSQAALLPLASGLCGGGDTPCGCYSEEGEEGPAHSVRVVTPPVASERCPRATRLQRSVHRVHCPCRSPHSVPLLRGWSRAHQRAQSWGELWAEPRGGECVSWGRRGPLCPRGDGAGPLREA